LKIQKRLDFSILNFLSHGRGNKLAETLKMVGFQHPQSPLPRREETKLAGNPKHGWVNEALDFLSKNMGIKKALKLGG